MVATCVGTLAACGSEEDPAAAPSCEGVELLVAASDYSSSMVCGAPRCEAGPRTMGTDLGKDPALSLSNGRAFFVARSEDLVFEVDPVCGVPTRRYSVHEEGSKQGAANPHDVAVAPDGALFVVLYNKPQIVVIKDGEPNAVIDISGYDDDRNPQADAIRIVSVAGQAKAFVTLQRLDDNSIPFPLVSRRASSMLRIDVATRTVEQSIELAGRNPFNVMAEHEGALFLAEPGNFDADQEAQAGIERFDTASSTTRLLVSEAALGGSVSEIAITSGCGAAIVAGPRRDVNPTSLVTFDPSSGQVFTTATTAVLGPTPGYDLQALAWRGDTLYVGDRRAIASGYRVHAYQRDPGTCTLHEVAARGIDLPRAPVALRPAAAR